MVEVKHRPALVQATLTVLSYPHAMRPFQAVRSADIDQVRAWLSMLERPSDVETTAMGAAFAAGLAVGVWDSTEALTELNGVEASFEPIIGKDACEAKLTRWQDAVTRTFDLA